MALKSGFPRFSCETISEEFFTRTCNVFSLTGDMSNTVSEIPD